MRAGNIRLLRYESDVEDAVERQLGQEYTRRVGLVIALGGWMDTIVLTYKDISRIFPNDPNLALSL